jgi:hypothetical protein
MCQYIGGPGRPAAIDMFASPWTFPQPMGWPGCWAAR